MPMDIKSCSPLKPGFLALRAEGDVPSGVVSPVHPEHIIGVNLQEGDVHAHAAALALRIIQALVKDHVATCMKGDISVTFQQNYKNVISF